MFLCVLVQLYTFCGLFVLQSDWTCHLGQKHYYIESIYGIIIILKCQSRSISIRVGSFVGFVVMIMY